MPALKPRPDPVLDTDRYLLIWANALGGCMGTTGPKDMNPAAGAQNRASSYYRERRADARRPDH
jgi:hypothetical protein